MHNIYRRRQPIYKRCYVFVRFLNLHVIQAARFFVTLQSSVSGHVSSEDRMKKDCFVLKTTVGKTRWHEQDSRFFSFSVSTNVF